MKSRNNQHSILVYIHWVGVHIVDVHQVAPWWLLGFVPFIFFTYVRSLRFTKWHQTQELLNCTGKTGDGIVGITKTLSALSWWALSFIIRSGIASAANMSCKICVCLIQNLQLKATHQDRYCMKRTQHHCHQQCSDSTYLSQNLTKNHCRT